MLFAFNRVFFIILVLARGVELFLERVELYCADIGLFRGGDSMLTSIFKVEMAARGDVFIILHRVKEKKWKFIV